MIFDGRAPRYCDGVQIPSTAEVALAVPGIVRDGRFVSASSFDWRDVDAAAELGIETLPTVICNDAEAAALGEWILRGKPPGGLALVSLGTGVGGAVVRAGGVTVANIFGHQRGYSDARCRCGEIGCLETVAAGWAAPACIDDARLHAMSIAIATAVDREVAASAVDLVVVTGGMADNNPRLVELISTALPGRTVVGSSRPTVAKSAAPWGLRYLARGGEEEHPIFVADTRLGGSS